MHLRNLKLANPIAHHTRAQVLLQKNQKARPKVAMALQGRDHLLRRMLVLKANPTAKMALRLQAWGLLVYRMMNLKASLTVEAVHLLQVVDLQVHQMQNLKIFLIVKAVHRLQIVDLQVHRMQSLKAIPTVRAAHYLQGRRTRQQESSSHLQGNHWDKVANRKLGLPDHCRRLVPKLSQAVSPWRTFPS